MDFPCKIIITFISKIIKRAVESFTAGKFPFALDKLQEEKLPNIPAETNKADKIAKKIFYSSILDFIVINIFKAHER